MIFVLAFPAGHAFALHCDASNPAAMPCCQHGPAECGGPGMSSACCWVTPAGSASAAGPSGRTLQKSSLLPWSLAPVLGVTSLAALGLDRTQSPRLSDASLAPRILPFFSRTSALRI
jgi:hypothetical protein